MINICCHSIGNIEYILLFDEIGISFYLVLILLKFQMDYDVNHFNSLTEVELKHSKSPVSEMGALRSFHM